MELFAVNRAINEKGNNIGLGLYDTSTGQVKLVPIDQVTTAIKQGAVKVENLEVINGALKGSNGDIDRLPTVTAQGHPIGDGKYTILMVVSDGTKTIGFDTVYSDGSCRTLTPNEIAFSGITNGKVIANNGDIIVSSIKGNYKVRIVKPLHEHNHEATERVAKAADRPALFKNGFTKSNLKDMRDILATTFKVIKDTHGIDLSIGSISFDTNRFTARLEANIIPDGKTKEQALFEEHASLWGLSVGDFGALFKYQNGVYKIVGVKPKADKYKIIGADTNTGKTYVFTVSIVKNNFM